MITSSVLRLVPYLVECGYFKKVNFIFLVVGHTKNAADRLFNALKDKYHSANIGTMDKLYRILDTSSKVTVYKTGEEDFHLYGDFLDGYYRNLEGLVKQNHIFSCNIANAREGNKFSMTIKENNLGNAVKLSESLVKQSNFGLI